MNVVNFVVSGGLLWIYWKRRQGKVEWNPPIKAGVFVTAFFTLSNLYLIIAPYVPPTGGQSVYNSLPYWIHCVVTWGIFAFGALYWLTWAYILPRFGGYQLVDVEVLGDDGFWRNKITKQYLSDAESEQHYMTETISIKQTDSSFKGSNKAVLTTTS